MKFLFHVLNPIVYWVNIVETVEQTRFTLCYSSRKRGHHVANEFAKFDDHRGEWNEQIVVNCIQCESR
jgi:hypothetical protein